MKKIRNISGILVLAAMTQLSCREDLSPVPGGGTEEPVLSAYKKRMTSRADGVGEYFEPGTKYRIWVTENNTTGPHFEGTGQGIEGTETIRQEDQMRYIDLGSTYNSHLTGGLDFYGFTAVTTTTDFIPGKQLTESYPIELKGELNGGDYTDYRRGLLKYTGSEATSGVLRMPFIHIMAQVKLEVMREEGVSPLELVSVEFVGAADSDASLDGAGIARTGTYNVYDNTFEVNETGVRTVTPEKGDTEEGCLKIPEVNSETGIAAEVRTVLVFPEVQDESLYYLRVTFNDPQNFYKKGTSEANPQTEIYVPIYDNRQTTATPLHFEQNTSYTLCISFLSNQARIVTLVPKVYEWLDGETDATDEEGNKYQEQDMGQPVTFNGVMWSDRNLGASGSRPLESKDEWYKSMGYFYQFGRNIPFFPYELNDNWQNDGRLVNVKMPAVEVLQGDIRPPLYPVVDLSGWDNWKAHQISMDITNESGIGNNLVCYVGEWAEDKQRFGFANYKNGIIADTTSVYAKHWEEGTKQPCPKGWRLPTTEDFKGIMPPNPLSGNITFRYFDFDGAYMPDAEMQWNLSQETCNYSQTGVRDEQGNQIYGSANTAEPWFEQLFRAEVLHEFKIPKSQRTNGCDAFPVPENPNQPTPHEEGGQAYVGGYPYIARTEINDPSRGYNSMYVLSMDEEDKHHSTPFTYNNIYYSEQYWGVIYVIKNVGTSRAYRMRWSIEVVPNSTSGTAGDAFPKMVLHIERFTASSTDVLTYENVKTDFEWTHPVAELYLPICGMSSSVWEGGKVINVGAEVCYLTAEMNRNTSGSKVFGQNTGAWIKILGDNNTNKMAALTNMHTGFGMQIRCVRDLTNK